MNHELLGMNHEMRGMLQNRIDEQVALEVKAVERNSEVVMAYIDIKSEGLRDILRVVLHDIKAISLMEEKPSIEQNILFHFLHELDEYAGHMNSPDCVFPRQHLRLLIDHLKQAYSAISQRLESILQHGHITYDLLWALFKPGCQVYTTCFGTKEPRCVIFDAGEEITQNDETWFNLECRFLDYDGVKFGEAGIFLRVPKFRGSKLIETQCVGLHSPFCLFSCLPLVFSRLSLFLLTALILSLAALCRFSEPSRASHAAALKS